MTKMSFSSWPQLSHVAICLDGLLVYPGTSSTAGSEAAKLKTLSYYGTDHHSFSLDPFAPLIPGSVLIYGHMTLISVRARYYE